MHIEKSLINLIVLLKFKSAFLHVCFSAERKWNVKLVNTCTKASIHDVKTGLHDFQHVTSSWCIYMFLNIFHIFKWEAVYWVY